MKSLANMCPLCRVYDPAWLMHFADCPLYRGRAITRVALVAAFYRRHTVKVRR